MAREIFVSGLPLNEAHIILSWIFSELLSDLRHEN